MSVPTATHETAATMGPQRRQALVDQVVLDHLWLARTLAHRYRDRGESLDDLVQVACLGLVKAAAAYRSGLGHSFCAYAVPTVMGELRRHFRDKGWDVRPPRRLQELRSRIRRVEEELGQTLGRAATAQEVAAALKVPREEVDEARAAAVGYSSVSLDGPPTGSDEGLSWGDMLPDQSGPEDGDLLGSLAVGPLLSALPARDQRILALRYYGGWTQQQIAQDIGVTQMQVSRLLTQALARLRRSAGIDHA